MFLLAPLLKRVFDDPVWSLLWCFEIELLALLFRMHYETKTTFSLQFDLNLDYIAFSGLMSLRPFKAFKA